MRDLEDRRPPTLQSVAVQQSEARVPTGPAQLESTEVMLQDAPITKSTHSSSTHWADTPVVDAENTVLNGVEQVGCVNMFEGSC